MSTSTYPIVGIKDGIGPDGSRPLRYEISKFVDPAYNPYAKEQLNLYLLALERIQGMSREERLSWFQIGGECVPNNNRFDTLVLIRSKASMANPMSIGTAPKEVQRPVASNGSVIARMAAFYSQRGTEFTLP